MSRVLLGLWLAALTALPAWGQNNTDDDQQSLRRLQALMRAARRGEVSATWSPGTLTLTLPTGGERGVRVALQAQLTSASATAVEVPLLPADTRLESVTIDGRAAVVVRRGGVRWLELQPGARKVAVALTYVVDPLADRAAALIPLPPLPGARWRIPGGPPGSELELWPGAITGRENGALVGTLPATFGALLRWGSDARGYYVRTAAYAMAPDPTGDGVDVEATLEVALESSSAWLPVAPGDVALLSVVEGKTTLASRPGAQHEARLVGAGTHVVRVRWRQRVDRTQGRSQVTLGMVAASITTVQATVPGQRTVEFDPAVPVTSRSEGTGDAVRTVATVQLPPSQRVVVRWTETRAPAEDKTRINSETVQLVKLAEGVIRSSVHLTYEVIRGQVKSFAVEIPEGAVLFKVAGQGIADWPLFAKTAERPRHVRIELDRERDGVVALVLDLEQRLGKTGDPLAVPLVRPLPSKHLFRQTGVVALFDGEKIGFAPATPDASLTPGGEDAIPIEIRKRLGGAKPGQVFKHIGSPGTLGSKVVETQPSEVSFDARVHTLFHVKEGVLSAHASALIEVKSGQTDRLLVQLPEQAKPLTWTVPSLAKRPEEAAGVTPPKGLKTYEIRLTRAFEGGIQIAVEYELRLPKQLGKQALPALRIPGAELEEGAFGIVAEDGIEVTAGAEQGVRRVDIGELPGAIRLQSSRELLLGYGYVRAPWSLELELKRHDLVQTLDAVVEHAWIESTAFATGHVKTMVIYQIANERQNHLRLELPKGATVLKLFRDGQPVKASRAADTITLEQLPKNTSFTVTVIYETKGDPLEDIGALTVSALRPDIRLADVQWLIRIHKDVWVQSVEGELEEIDAREYRAAQIASQPSIRRFSALARPGDYVSWLFTREQVRAGQPALKLEVDLGIPLSFWGQLLGWLIGVVVALFLLNMAIRVGKARRAEKATERATARERARTTRDSEPESSDDA